MRAPLLFAAAALCAAPSAVIGQVSVTQSTAGVPLSQNVGDGQTMVTYPASQGGTSTGTSIVFQSGSSGSTPSNVVASTTLTGAAASEAAASISSAGQQEKGSNGGFSSTTGGAIAGISTGLPGGFNEPTPTSSGAAGSGQSSSQSATDGQLSAFVIGKTVSLSAAAVAMLLGAVLVL